MLLPSLFCTLALLSSSSALLVAALSSPGSVFVKDKYIVQLSSSTTIKRSLPLVGLVDDFLRPLLQIIDPLATIGNQWNEPGIFNGAVVQLSSSLDLSALLDLDGVEAVFPVRRYRSPQAFSKTNATDMTTGDTFAPHVMTGVSKLHEEGYYGKGVVIGILDTGVDYMHPALGGGFGPGFRIAGGYDFAGNTYNGASNLVISPDADPFADASCGGHGTHVAGILAASSTAPNPIFTGVVPEATIYAYKIFGCTDPESGLSYTDDELVISALIQAYQDGADVITLSLGSSSGWSESPSSAVASALVERGRVVTAAQGNEGSAGAFYGAAPASGKNVWAVGSADNLGLVAFEATIADSTTLTSFPYFASVPLNISSLPLYPITLDSSTNNTGDACSALPSSLDLSGYVVLVKRGTCTFAEKYAVVAAAGAKHLIIYNSAAAFSYLPDASSYLESVAIVSADTGASLVTLAASAGNSSALVSATNSTVLAIPYDSAGRVSQYSSYGPNFEMDQPSPAFVAPGGQILSTWLLDGGGYAILSGTSMATPFAAGAAALYLSIKGKRSASALEMRDIFVATSTPISNYSGSAILESVLHQGGGLINVYDAVYQPIRISPGFLLLNDTRNFNSIHKITVKNTGDKAVTLEITHEAAGTALSFVKGSKVLHNSWPVPLVDSAATVIFSKSKLKIDPRKSATFLATFVPPFGLDPSLAPFYSGYIKVGANLTIPYYGLAASLKGLQVLDDTSDLLGVDLPTLIGADDNVIPMSTTNTTVSLSYNSSAIQVVFRLVTGTRFFAVDVVKASTKLQPTVAKRSILEYGDFKLHKAVKRGLLPLVDGLAGGVVEVASDLTSSLLDDLASSSRRTMFGSIGTLQTQDYAYRNAKDNAADYYYITFNGTITPSSAGNLKARNLEPGSYKLLLRALRLTGDPNSEADYETWLSAPIEVVK